MIIRELQDPDRTPIIADVRPWMRLVDDMLASQRRELDTFWHDRIPPCLVMFSAGASLGNNSVAFVGWLVSALIGFPWMAVMTYRRLRER